MEKTAITPPSSNNNNRNRRRKRFDKTDTKNPSAQNSAQKNKSDHKYIPKWETEPQFKGKEFKETKADLMSILEQVDPEELLIIPLVQKKILKNIKKDTNKINIETEEITISEDNKTKIKIDISQECPICGKIIREIMYALHDYEHDKLAHFDCVYRKVTENVKDKMSKNRHLAYLGSGSFGIMEVEKNKTKLIEKIYPGAPVEELLHSDPELTDKELQD